MKKLFAVVFCMLLVLPFSACGERQKAQELYDAIGSISFNDVSILTSEELAQVEEMRARKEQYLKEANVEGLISLQEAWTAFRGPIDALITQYQTACASFFSEEEKALLTESEWNTVSGMESAISEAYANRDSDALSKAITEWETGSKNLRDVIRTLHEIERSQSPISETDYSLLSTDTRTNWDALSDRTKAAFEDRDAATLEALKVEWDGFRDSAKREIESAKEKLLSDWVNAANLTDSFANLLSFGTTTSSTSINGHKITLITRYNVDVNASQAKAALQSYLDWTSAVFEGGVSSLKTHIDDVCIRVEYQDQNGNVLCYKEFR